jgi:ABC-2 type transport system ATP-binding protein
VAAEDIALRRPTLDEVFLHLTGTGTGTGTGASGSGASGRTGDGAREAVAA